MSANNWTICPKCEAEESKNAKEFSKKVEEAYGKVPVNEYLKMREQYIEPTLDSTLREDYEVGVWEGVFEVSYRCYCNICGYSFEYKHKQQLP